MNCPYSQLLAFVTAQETFVNSSPSPVNPCSYTDKIVSTECRDLVPRQRTGTTVIVPGFTSFIEDFVIRCYRSLIASSAQNPRNFRS